MPQSSQWYTMQVDGKWYKTEANSPDEAKMKIHGSQPQAPRVLPQTPEYGVTQPTFASKVGSYIPDWAGSALGAANRFAVQPFESMAQKGAEVGGKIGEMAVEPMQLQGKETPEQFKQNSPVLAGIGKGAGEVAGSVVADPRNWPLMGSGAVRPALQKLMTRGFVAMMSKGTYDAFSQLYKNWDNLTPAQRAELGTQGGLSALMATALAAHWSGSSAGTEVVDQGAKLKAEFGKEAEAKPVATAPAPTQESLRAKIVDLRAQIEAAEAKAPPAPKAEDAVEQVRRGAPEQQATHPAQNMVPEGQRASDIIAKEQEEKLRAKMESRGEAKQMLEKQQPSEIDRIAQIRQQIAARRDTDLEGLKEENARLQEAKRLQPEAKPVEETPLERKQRESRNRQLEEQKIKSLQETIRYNRDEEISRLQKENQRLREQSETPSGLPSAPEASKPIAKPGEVAPPAPGPREPVRPAEVAKVNVEPRLSEEIKTAPRPDLGQRPAQQASGQIDFNKRMEIFRQRVEAEMAKPENKGVAKGEIQRRVGEALKKELGGFGGSNPEDIRARREAKIGQWIDQLRDKDAKPETIDRAFNMLKAYGLEHDEIIRRVSGAEGFAETPREQRGSEEQQAAEDLKARLQKEMSETRGLIEGLTGQVDATLAKHPLKEDDIALAARQEGFRKGEASVTGVKDAGVEELEKMFNLRDERGFWRLLPPKSRPAPTPGALGDLINHLESAMKTLPPDDSRMQFGERLKEEMTEGWDNVQKSLGRMAGQAAALKDTWWRGHEEPSDYRTAIGRFSGSLNRSAVELYRFAKEIKDKLPDKRQREAITNWIQADGDDKVLADRSNRSGGSIRAGYERARNLTPEELSHAQWIKEYFEHRLKDAVKMGLLQDGLDNYVPQIWKAKDQSSMSNFFSSLHRGGLLKPDFNAAKHRMYDSYFEGEQAGRTPVNKDIGFLVASWDRAFNQAIASRNLIRDLTTGIAKDGRPIVSPSGTGKTIWNSGSQSPMLGDEPDAYVIYPKASVDETGDYRALNHNALTKWKWATQDGDGNPIFVKGDLRVHPDHAKVLDNVINRGRWAADHPIQTSILKGQAFFKATLLSMSPFHQIQEGTHALFHMVQPFHPPEIDLASPSLNKLLDKGLVLGNFDPVANFDEGLTAGSGGLVGKIPGLGALQQKYSSYLFQDYIPRLKAKMASEAYERNIRRFQNQIQSGRMTTDHVAEITANQANAAFGELNYIMMGRSPQTQATLRMMLLAPDFLEARARFAGQALSPAGKEQTVALLRGALGMYGVARVLNKLLDDDYHWDKPFSLIVNGYEYKMRSLPGDIWHLMEDPNSFIQHRLSPFTKAAWELGFGRDDFGRKRNFGEQIMDFARSITPIPGQGMWKATEEGLGKSFVTSALSSAGVTRSKYRTKAGALAHQYAIGSNPNDVTSHHISEIVRDIDNNELNGDKITNLLMDGKMNPDDVVRAMELAQYPELYRDYRGLPVELKARIIKLATPQEAAMLATYSKQELHVTKLLAEQGEQFMKDMANQ